MTILKINNKEKMLRNKIEDKIGKEGKVSVEFLIGVIILVVSFVVILFLIFLVKWNPVIDKETCHQSVVYRASAQIGAINIKEAIPLKCQTEKICLTMSGDDCGLAVSRKNPVTKIKLSRENQEAKEKIKDVLAESLVSCHSMLGEGKLNFMPSSLIGKNKKYGLICTRVVFDDEARKKIESINFIEFYSYLEKKSINGQDKQSYLDYLYPEIGNSRKFLDIYNLVKEEAEKSELENVKFAEIKDWKIDLKQENGYAVIASITPTSQTVALLKGVGVGAATAVVGGALIFTGIGSPLGVTFLSTAFLSSGAGGAVFLYNLDEEYAYSPPTIYPYDIKKLKELEIYSFEIAP